MDGGSEEKGGQVKTFYLLEIIRMTKFICLFILSFLLPSILWAEEEKAEPEIKELSGMSIIGNKEAPKSLYIVPWKSSEVGVERELISTLMDNKLKPLDKEVFMRELEFYQLSLSDN